MPLVRKTTIPLLLFACMAAWAAPAPDGAEVYKKYCASCHDSGQARVPNRESLKQKQPEAILVALQFGTMTVQGTPLSAAEQRAVAEFLSGKPLRPGLAGGDEQQAGRCAEQPRPRADLLAGPQWNGWGADLSNTRFQPAAIAGLTADQVPRLKLKWAFGFPGATVAFAQPTIAGGRVFVGSAGGYVYSLDAATGCTYWSYKAAAAVRTAISIGPLGGSGSRRFVAYFGDLAANVYAVDAASGELLWKTRVEDQPYARVTGSPLLYSGRLYVPVSSWEEGPGGDPRYECCHFRGSVVALDARNGKQVWKTYSIADPPRPTRKNSVGTQLWGPAGGAIWASPTLDLKQHAIYVGTGNNYSDPPAATTDAILALDMDSGRLVWSRQMTEGDTFLVACFYGVTANCPEKPGPDFDFGNSPVLRPLAGGRRVLVVGQKSGVVYALDPDRKGETVWQVRVGKGGALGGVEWGTAADETAVYVPVSDVTTPATAGGLFALRLDSGEKVWNAPPPRLDCKPGIGCNPAQSAAVTAIPGVVFSGSVDGHLRAYSTKDGAIVWDFDTQREFATVNRVQAKGGSLDGPGPVVAGGMLYVNSGYGMWAGAPGNVLLAFSADRK